MTNYRTDRPFIYIASPYTEGDVGINVRYSMLMFDTLLTEKVVIPFTPLWSHYQHILIPRSWQEWVDYDLSFLSRFDAILRVNVVDHDYFQSESIGADNEVKLMESLNKPVFYDKESLYIWADHWEYGA